MLIGPYGINAFDPRSWSDHQNEITLEVLRLVLVAGLFAVGVELPRAYMKKHAKGLLIMVVPTMAFGWIVVSSRFSLSSGPSFLTYGGSQAIIHALFPKLNLASALCISACLTPTDPVTCAAITRMCSRVSSLLMNKRLSSGGRFARKHVPPEIRHILSAEAAANDGLAYPFLSISLYLMTESSVRVAIQKGFLIGWLCKIFSVLLLLVLMFFQDQVMFGTFLGAILGELPTC